MIASRTPILCFKIDDSSIIDLLETSFEIHQAAAHDHVIAALQQTKAGAVLIQVRSLTDELALIGALKKNFLTCNVPVILLTQQDLIHDRIEALNHGIDDFVLVPCHPGELVARVNRTILRTERALSCNALTRLPGNLSIQEKILGCIQDRQPFAAIWIDIDHFKSFNDSYGYEAGDNVIRMLGTILVEAMENARCGQDSGFVGHIGGDDFVMVMDPTQTDRVCAEVIRRFDAASALLYPSQVRECGFIVMANRRGVSEEFPLMSLTMAGVSSTHRTLSHPGQVSEICSEIKTYLKKKTGSKYLIDRRTDREGTSRLVLVGAGNEHLFPPEAS